MIECMKELVGYSERRVRAVVAELPDGEYSYTDYVDGCGDKYPDPLPIKVKINIKGDDLTILQEPLSRLRHRSTCHILVRKQLYSSPLRH